VNSRKSRADRIAIIVSSLGGGGAERVVVDLGRYLRDAGRDVTLFTLSGDDNNVYAAPEGVRRIRLDIRRKPHSLLDSIRSTFRHLRLMREQIKSVNPDVVLSFVDQTNIRTILCLLGTGVPVIISERVHPAYVTLSPVWRLARQFAYPLADAVTVQTEDGAAWLRRRTYVRRPIVIANAVRYQRDLRNLAANSQPAALNPFILAMGRLTEQKGFDLLLRAFHQSDLIRHGWRLAILGDGAQFTTLQQQAASLGIANAVTLPGYVSAIGPWLGQAEIFVLSSRYEGFPNVLMEAMQVGRACISFDCPSGPRELIKAGINGCLVPAEDVAALAASIRRMAFDPGLRSRLGAEATKVNERFSPEVIYSGWLRLLDARARRRSGKQTGRDPDQRHEPAQ
jgi:GalNAc-alpha-(1->4)-GalNAc-alpha-(1->3)-diNAcBac-PP-undecaprenol alpha-1,4-N-acetyl-D-galactosaminyltransferase